MTEVLSEEQVAAITSKRFGYVKLHTSKVRELMDSHEALRQRVQALEEMNAELEEITLRGVLGYVSDAKEMIEQALAAAEEKDEVE